jgi:uroporphyrinogen-III synthase
MYVLVTRPITIASGLCSKLEELGCQVIVEPMLTIENDLQQSNLSFSEFQAIIVTSKHGLWALALFTNVRSVPLVVIGEETASEAMRLGFGAISACGYAQTSANLLAKFVVRNYNQENGKILYISGNEVAGQVEKILTENLFKVERVILYKSVPAVEMTMKLQNLLATAKVNAASFCSSRTAEIFIDLLVKYGLQDKMNEVVALGLSENIAQKLHQINWKQVRVASNIDLMVEQIGQIGDR